MGIGQKMAALAKKALGIDGNQIYLDPPQWDDLSEALIGARLDTSSGRLDYDYFNGGVNFQDNTRYPNEPVVISLQARHAMVIGAGAVLRPHMHWLQQQAAVPNFLIGIKTMNWGEATGFETDFSNYLLFKWDVMASTYPGSGTFAQIACFPEIDISSLTLSGTINVALFRDSTNVSGLFSGVDPVAEDVTVVYNDSHVLFNSSGSRQEFIK